MRRWKLRDRELDLQLPGVVGILNRTPDSFSDGGSYLDLGAALERAGQVEREGACLLDIGGESTRPGAPVVPASVELERVLPVVEAYAGELPISVDTNKAEVARRVLQAGAHVINDVSACRFDPAMAPVVGELGAGLVLMHMKGRPKTMQQSPSYRDVLEEVYSSLARAAERAQRQGVAPECLVVDPGIGFGKRLDDNLRLLAGIPRLGELGFPVLIGLSRKSFLGQLTGRSVDQRGPAGCAAHAYCLLQGADLLRVHSVGQAVDVVKVIGGCLQAQRSAASMGGSR